MRNRTALPGQNSRNSGHYPVVLDTKPAREIHSAREAAGRRRIRSRRWPPSRRMPRISAPRSRGIRDRRRRDRARPGHARGRDRPRGRRARAAPDDESTRPDRGRDRNRQDEDAAGHRRAALGSRRRGLRRRREGRRLGDRASRARTTGPPKKRARELGIEWAPAGFPVEYLSLGGIGPGVPVRATVSDFGPLLLAKVLGSNQTQEQSLVARLPLRRSEGSSAPRSLRPPRAAHVPRLRSGQGGAQGHRRALTGDGGVLLRSLIGLEQGGGNDFFGEPQLDIADLVRTAPDGRGSSPASSCRPCRTGRGSGRRC